MSSPRKKKKKRNSRNKKSNVTSEAIQHDKKRLSKRGIDAFNFLASTDPRFKIVYLIPHHPQELDRFSFFAWYSPALLETARLLMRAATLPADIREIVSSPSNIILHRLMRRIWPNIIPIELDALFSAKDMLKGPFRVFLSNDESVAKEVDRFILQSGWPCLHVSSIESPERIALDDFDLNILLAYCQRVVLAMPATAEWRTFAETAWDEIGDKVPRSPKRHHLRRGLHNVTTPNELALEAFGWTLSQVEPISKELTPGLPNPQRYVDRICLSARTVSDARAELTKNYKRSMMDYRYIVAIQGIYWGHFNEWQKLILKAKSDDQDVIRLTYKAAVNATTYFDTINTEAQEKGILDNEMFRVFQSTRSAEALAFTAGLTILASASLAPVLRLEPKLNRVRGDLKQIAKCDRAHSHHQFDWKISRLTRKLGEKMLTLIDPKFLALLEKPEDFGIIEGIKLVTDLPLELMPVGQLPLSMRFDTSRVAPMPGNLYLMNCIMPPVVITLEEFREILIVRSFGQDDPLRDMIAKAIDASQELEQTLATFNVKIRLVDVSTEDEFVDALNHYSGALMIFDGHGSSSNNIGAGTIVIGGKEIDAWQLKKRCSVPPIVVFSACDTQPLDGSHSSVATAAFTLGARTVLGTMLPVNGKKAAMFIGRLLFRIMELLPIATKHSLKLTWRDVISGMLRMSYATEVMMLLKKNGGAAYQGLNFDDAQFVANREINARNPKWYDMFRNELSRLTQISVEIIDHDIAKWASMTDSMKYVQLGNPESIIIVEEDASLVFQNELAALASKAGI